MKTAKRETDYEYAEIIEDSDNETNNKEIKISSKPSSKPSSIKKPKVLLKPCFKEDPSIIEIGVDEAGRGPLFGRVYTAAVILPKDGTFDCSKVKDSKKFHSKKKIEEAAEYIQQNALAWAVTYADEQTIDEINILQATQLSMHDSIREVQTKYKLFDREKTFQLLIDGNYFNPMTTLNKQSNKLEVVPYTLVEGGDNTYASIAAASILAKVFRDQYIEQLCEENPELNERYGIHSNKGYGAKKHLDGIKEHGITIWHRRSFAPCKHYV